MRPASGRRPVIAATLAAAQWAVSQMGAVELARSKALVVGADSALGAASARLLAQVIQDIVLVSTAPENLNDLKQAIEQETPGVRITLAANTFAALPDCDLIVTAAAPFGPGALEINRCKPGAVICDIARPPAISKAEADTHADVLVIAPGVPIYEEDLAVRRALAEKFRRDPALFQSFRQDAAHSLALIRLSSAGSEQWFGPAVVLLLGLALAAWFFRRYRRSL